MSTREFWEDDPDLLWAYRKSYVEKTKFETEKDNYIAWLHGLYIHNAVNIVIYNAFCRKEGQPAQEYIKEPYDFSKTKEQIRKEKILAEEEKIKRRNQEIKEMLNKRKVGEH